MPSAKLEPREERGTYHVILADPPWQYRLYTKETPRSKSARAGMRGVALTFDAMSLGDIKALPVQEMAERNAALFLWVTMPCLPEGLEVIKAWGFKYKTVAFTWVKTNKMTGRLHMGLGHYTRGNPELCLLATRGNMKRKAANVEQVIVASKRQHSRKPDEQYGRIMRLFDGPYVELFARQQWPGWDVYGDQVEMFAAQTPLVSERSQAARLVVGL